MNIRSKGQRSRSQDHKVYNVATRQPCCTVWRLVAVVSSRNETVPHGCLIVWRGHNKWMNDPLIVHDIHVARNRVQSQHMCILMKILKFVSWFSFSGHINSYTGRPAVFNKRRKFGFTSTVKRAFFACPLFREFRDLGDVAITKDRESKSHAVF